MDQAKSNGSNLTCGLAAMTSRSLYPPQLQQTGDDSRSEGSSNAFYTLCPADVSFFLILFLSLPVVYVVPPITRFYIESLNRGGLILIFHVPYLLFSSQKAKKLIINLCA